MFMRKCITWQSLQKYAWWAVAVTMDSRLPRVITGNICLKSPSRTTSLPPKAFSLSHISLRWRLIALNVNRFIIGVSFQIIKAVFRVNSVSESTRKVQTSYQRNKLTSHQVVRVFWKLSVCFFSPSSNKKAIPDDATVRTICLSNQNLDIIGFHK